MKFKRVFYISKYAMSPLQGGPTRQYLFSKYFAKQNVRTTLISSDSSGGNHIGIKKLFNNYDITHNFNHIILKGSKIKLGFSIKRIISWIMFEYRLLKYFNKSKVNKNSVVIVSSLSILTFLTGVYLKKKYKTCLIVEVRDIWPRTLVDFGVIGKYNIMNYVLSKIEYIGYSNADLIVGSMKNLCAHLNTIDNSFKDKFLYMPMGYDNEKANSFKKTPSKKFTIGYAGSIGKTNNLKLLLNAASLLKNNKKIEFKILGDGQFKKKLMNEFKCLENVVFLKKVDKNYVHNFLINCDVLVSTWLDCDIYNFGISPNKWIDYMIAARPIIVPFNGYRNIINDANCGEFIETNNPQLLADTILKYSKYSKSKLDEIGLRGKKYLLSNFTYDLLSEKYIKNIFKNKSNHV
ncbi:MAG: glycosyltransferase family 4 protein [Bacteroidota bacterium]|nr:glycosyltransferase family 4 protein [Bacteroidota bacterium]